MAACYDNDVNDFSAPHVYNRLFLIKSRFSYSHARVHCEIRTDVHIPKCRSDKNRFWDKDIFTQSFAAFCPNKEITRRTRQRLINTYTFGRKKNSFPCHLAAGVGQSAYTGGEEYSAHTSSTILRAEYLLPLSARSQDGEIIFLSPGGRRSVLYPSAAPDDG